MGAHIPLVGARWWRLWLEGDQLRLGSWNRPIRWELRPRAVMRATHITLQGDVPMCKQLGPAPESDCTCGIYAWWNVDEAWKGIKHWHGKSGMAVIEVPGQIAVAGAVIAGGDVCIHPEGFRAAEAQIVALAVDEREHAHPWAQQAAEQLGVPLMIRKDLKRWSAEFGRVAA